MSNHCLDKLPLSNFESTWELLERHVSLSRVPLDAGMNVTAPLITYVDPIELSHVDGGTRSSSPKRPRRKCRHCRLNRRRSFSARARQQRRRVVARLDALPIARRARAAGLHGAALRAYVGAVAAVDGPAALLE